MFGMSQIVGLLRRVRLVRGVAATMGASQKVRESLVYPVSGRRAYAKPVSMSQKVLVWVADFLINRQA